MENTVFGKEENKNAGILTENLENYCVRNGCGDSPLFELADRLKNLKDQKKQKELELKSINDMIFEVDATLSELMIIKETQNFTRGGTTFCLTTSTKASAVAGLKDELYSKLREKGYEDLIHETINANSLSSFVKEQMSENDNLLPSWLEGFVNVYEKNTVGVRKATK